MMKTTFRLLFFLIFTTYGFQSYAQTIIEDYAPAKKDSLRIDVEDDDFMAYIQSGYTLMLPNDKTVEGVLIFLEDSGYDQKNKSAKQLYSQANENTYAVLSVSTEIPFDFFFSEESMSSAHNLIKRAFVKYDLPNKNIFFLGASLTGHRALRYIKFASKNDLDFQLNIEGIVICNFTLDWTRKWYQHQREIRLNRNSLWEAKFMNYMLVTHLGGTPLTVPENYHNFSTYSYFDKENRNISIYKDFAIRGYIKPDILYRFTKYLQTLYENSATDIVGFLTELELIGNKNTDLVVLESEQDPSKRSNADTTWEGIDKKELMDWILKQSKE